MRWSVLPLLILTSCAGSTTPSPSKKQPSLGLPGVGGSASQSDASAGPTGPIHHICVKSADITFCGAPYPDGYMCKDPGMEAGATAPAGVPVLTVDQADTHCISGGAATKPGESIACCAGLGAEFAD